MRSLRFTVLGLDVKVILLAHVFVHQNVLKELVELDSSCLLKLGANTPDQCVDQCIVQDFFGFFRSLVLDGRIWVFVFVLLLNHFVPALNEGVDHLNHVVHQEVRSSDDALLALQPDELAYHIGAIVHQLLKLVNDLFVDEPRQIFAVRVNEHTESK